MISDTEKVFWVQSQIYKVGICKRWDWIAKDKLDDEEHY